MMMVVYAVYKYKQKKSELKEHCGYMCQNLKYRTPILKHLVKDSSNDADFE